MSWWLPLYHHHTHHLINSPLTLKRQEIEIERYKINFLSISLILSTKNRDKSTSNPLFITSITSFSEWVEGTFLSFSESYSPTFRI